MYIAYFLEFFLILIEFNWVVRVVKMNGIILDHKYTPIKVIIVIKNEKY